MKVKASRPAVENSLSPDGKVVDEAIPLEGDEAAAAMVGVSGRAMPRGCTGKTGVADAAEQEAEEEVLGAAVGVAAGGWEMRGGGGGVACASEEGTIQGQRESIKSISSNLPSIRACRTAMSPICTCVLARAHRFTQLLDARHDTIGQVMAVSIRQVEVVEVELALDVAREREDLEMGVLARREDRLIRLAHAHQDTPRLRGLEALGVVHDHGHERGVEQGP